jgi:putative transposase
MANLAPAPLYYRNLPHIQPPGATYFITFRLAGSIPASKLAELHEEAHRIQVELARAAGGSEYDERRYLEQRRLFARWDDLLDGPGGPQWLADPAVAAMVVESLVHLEGKQYELVAYCIMPNHVHLVITPLRNPNGVLHSLAHIMHSLKGFTARRGNALLGRSGSFWQHESYDHYVRDPSELERIVAYVVSNPVKARLVSDWMEWRWSYCGLAR